MGSVGAAVGCAVLLEAPNPRALSRAARPGEVLRTVAVGVAAVAGVDGGGFCWRCFRGARRDEARLNASLIRVEGAEGGDGCAVEVVVVDVVEEAEEVEVVDEEAGAAKGRCESSLATSEKFKKLAGSSCVSSVGDWDWA